MIKSFVCPHCNVMITPEYTHIVVGNQAIPIGYNGHYIYRCTNPDCNKLIYAIWGSGKSAKIVDMYPKRIPQIDKSIPLTVASDFIEAAKCFDNECFKASASMCRRALQSSVFQKGANGRDLIDQIDDLYSKGIITSDLKDWAHEIRITGNTGAHPDKDGLKDVGQDEAREILDFMESYLNYVYTMPSKVAEKKAKRYSIP